MTGVPTTSAERPPAPCLKLDLRAEISRSAQEIRALKPHVRTMQRVSEPQAPAMQSEFAKMRNRARARYLVYGALRGRPWSVTEATYPDGDPEFRWFALYLVRELERRWPDETDWEEVKRLLS